MAHRAAKKSRATISDDKASDPLNIDTGFSKSISDSSDEEEENEQTEGEEIGENVLMTSPPTGVKKQKKVTASE